jgi:hypothetical protein
MGDKSFLKGLLYAGLGSAIVALAAAWYDPSRVNLSAEGLKAAGSAAVSGALAGFVGYLANPFKRKNGDNEPGAGR